MKKVSALFFALVIMAQSFAAFTANAPASNGPSPLHASQILLPVGTMGKTISLMELSTLKVKDYQSMTGQQMRFADKVAFKLSQKELRKIIKSDGTVDVKKMETLTKKMQKAADNKTNLRWALIFGGIAVILSILGAFIPFVFILASIAWLVAVVFLIIWLVNMAK